MDRTETPAIAKAAGNSCPRAYSHRAVSRLYVRHEGAGFQRMKVPREELSVQLCSCPGGESEQSGESKPWGQRRA
jgi:hypothetical protein